MKVNFKKILFICLSVSLLFLSNAASANLINNEGKKSITEYMKTAGDSGNFVTTGGTNGDYLISDVASTIIKAVLGILGIIFLIMVLIGGFNWMTAAGNDSKVTSAKATLIRGVIGLIILVTAYIITAFVFRALSGVVGSPG